MAITAASLTLVFLGFLLASWESYDTQGKAAVRQKYKTRALIAFWGVVFSLASVLLGFIAVGTEHAWAWADIIGAGCLALWGVLTTAQAVIALRDIK